MRPQFWLSILIEYFHFQGLYEALPISPLKLSFKHAEQIWWKNKKFWNSSWFIMLVQLIQFPSFFAAICISGPTLKSHSPVLLNVDSKTKWNIPSYWLKIQCFPNPIFCFLLGLKVDQISFWLHWFLYSWCVFYSVCFQEHGKDTHQSSSVIRTVQVCMEKCVRQPAPLTVSGKMSLFVIIVVL